METEVRAIGCGPLRSIVLIRGMTFSDLRHETITSERVLRRARSRRRETNGYNVSKAQKSYESLVFSSDNFRHVSWMGVYTISRNRTNFLWRPCCELLSTINEKHCLFIFRTCHGFIWVVIGSELTSIIFPYGWCVSCQCWESWLADMSLVPKGNHSSSPPNFCFVGKGVQCC